MQSAINTGGFLKMPLISMKTRISMNLSERVPITPAPGKMLSLFKQHQEALLAAQEAATDADDLASKKTELDALFAAEKKKIKKAEKQEKAKARQEQVNSGLAKQTKAAKVDEFELLKKKYVKHSRWYDYQRARWARPSGRRPGASLSTTLQEVGV